MGGQNIDVVLRSAHIGKFSRNRGKPFVPKGHGEHDAVRFGRRSEVLARARTCQAKRVAQYAIYPMTGENALLADQFPLRALEHTPADIGVFPFGVLAHDVKIDLLRAAVGKRRTHSGQKPARTEIDILVKSATDRNQKPPEGDMIGNPRPAHRAEEDRVRLAKPIEPVGRHHGAGFLIAHAGPIIVLILQGEPEPRGSGIQHAHAFGHGFLADSIPGNRCDAIGFAHEFLSLKGRGLSEAGHTSMAGEDPCDHSPTGSSARKRLRISSATRSVSSSGARCQGRRLCCKGRACPAAKKLATKRRCRSPASSGKATKTGADEAQASLSARRASAVTTMASAKAMKAS